MIKLNSYVIMPLLVAARWLRSCGWWRRAAFVEFL